VDIGVAQGAGGVVGTTWGTTNILGVARGAIEERGAMEVDEAHDEKVMKGQAVRQPGVAAGQPSSIPRAV
jgi:hypothetical protein